MRIIIEGKLAPELRELVAQLEVSKEALHRSMGTEVQNVTVAYIAEQESQRHTTANRLGATPSGHLERAKEQVAEGSALTADNSNATLTINHPGLSRAFREVTITPKNAKMLTIPVHAMAYNRRAGQDADLFVFKWRFNAFLAKRQESKDAPPLLMYLLVRSVTQKQDRTLLPSDEQWEKAAVQGAEDGLTMLLKEGGHL